MIEDYGPKLWYLIHYYAKTLSGKQDQQDLEYVRRRLLFLRFIYSLRYLIPCASCRKHFNEKLISMDCVGIPGSCLFLWTYMVHNNVNDKLKKAGITFKQAKQMYDSTEEAIKCMWYILFTFSSNLSKIKASELPTFLTIVVDLLPKDERVKIKAILNTHPIEKYPKTSSGMFLYVYTINQIYDPSNETYSSTKKHFKESCDQCKLL